jgi:sugar lactone lactonase YvrE
MQRANPILDFELDKSVLQYVGSELQRPECILAEPNGSLWIADARGGVMHLRPDGERQIIAQRHSERFGGAATEASRYIEGTLPNGLAFAGNGDILIANFGTDRLEIMTRDGESKILADQIDGQPIGKVNFVLRDSKDRIWITVSTRVRNWMHALRPDLSDGYIARYIDGAFRIVAEGFHFTNEIRMDAREEYLYVVETTGGCISRMRVSDDGALSNRERFGPSSLGKGAWPDGIAFDCCGNLWGTMVYSDKLFALTPQGDLRIFLDEGDPSRVEALEKAFLRNQVDEEVLFATGRGVAPWMASVTFGGPDLQTLYIGSLRGTRIPYFRAPAPGLPMVHWAF